MNIAPPWVLYGTCVDIAPNDYISESYTIPTTLRGEDMRSSLWMFGLLFGTFHARNFMLCNVRIYMGRRDEGGAYLGTHAVLVTGCGCEEGVPYLEIQNS
ncbi:hypothetical protein Leryth_018105 [Lithospermum erythrorhizon]|nr:hypothetical protein Leryth_018105 [Lithospermum erythrorhizon]